MRAGFKPPGPGSGDRPIILTGLPASWPPDLALRSMAWAPSRAGFVIAGVVLLVVGAWAEDCLWHGGGSG
jgi:hypothetical protein